MLSVLIPAKNEIGNISDCIKSASFADEIIVVDSRSTDGTQEAAKLLGAKVIDFEWTGHYPKKKNWALTNIKWKNDWILIVDADERITPELAAEITEAIRSDKYEGYYLNRKFMFMGHWLRHCGYYPSWNLRLFKHKLGRYEKLDVSVDTRSGDNEVHEHLLLNGKAGHLKSDMLHYAYPTIDVWIEKHNRYSNWEACVAEELLSGEQEEKLIPDPFGNALERRRWLRRISKRLPFRPTLRFLYHYVAKQGFRDGYRGWVFCRLLAWYEFVSIAKYRERRIKSGNK